MRRLLGALLVALLFLIASQTGPVLADVGEPMDSAVNRYGNPLMVKTFAGNYFTWREYQGSGVLAKYHIHRFTENGMLIEVQIGIGFDKSNSELNPTVVIDSERFRFDRAVSLKELGNYLHGPVKLLKDPAGEVFTNDAYLLPVLEGDETALTVATVLPDKGLLVGLVLEYGTAINIVKGRYDITGDTKVRQVYVGSLKSSAYSLMKIGKRDQPDADKVRAALLQIPGPVLPDRLESNARKQAASMLRDVEKHWAKDAILDLVVQGIVSGYPDNTFRPEDPISRAAFVKLIVGPLGLPHEGPSSAAFSDMTGHWAEQYVAAAVKDGFVIPAEYPEGRFNPDRDITRAEMAAMVARAAGLVPSPENAKVFKDGAQILPLYLGFIGAVSRQGIITGFPDGSFGPDRPATRAQAVVIVSRMLKLKK